MAYITLHYTVNKIIQNNIELSRKISNKRENLLSGY